MFWALVSELGLSAELLLFVPLEVVSVLICCGWLSGTSDCKGGALLLGSPDTIPLLLDRSSGGLAHTLGVLLTLGIAMLVICTDKYFTSLQQKSIEILFQ